MVKGVLNLDELAEANKAELETEQLISDISQQVRQLPSHIS